MNKRLFRTLLCLNLILCLAVPVCAEPLEQQETVKRKLEISTAEEFLAFAENCRLDSYSQDLVVTLEADIDLEGADFAGVPVFSGTFRGRGHTICGLSITDDGSYQGLFRYLTAEALVHELKVSGDIQPEGSRNAVGAIAGSNAGSILRCEIVGSVSGGDYVGGIAGQNTVTGVIEDCKVQGDIYGDHFVGGIAGENCGVIRNCSNEATVNVTPQQNTVAIADITMDTLTNSEAANTTTDIGGIAGISSGVIRACTNTGDIGYKHMGYNIGGIAGTQSGYLTDAENYGCVQGRKEVGGITGQMEPVTQIEFSEDTLQILQGQLDTMSGLVSSASGNARSNAEKISGQIAILQDQTQTAKDAVKVLLPNAESPQIPDADTILAAQNTLSKTMESMPGTVREIASAAQSTVSGISRDLNAISGQIGVMSQTISNASENLGGSITDISDMDTPELLTGKVSNCTNYGSILADLNVGGIAGAIALENDLDILEDWDQQGESSLNFQSEVRAVILDCCNSGVITGKKQNVGGITGWHSLGLIKNSTNTGKVDGAGADYVGGVAGQSTGFIRSGFANCALSGDAYVGGIAGSAVTVTDSRAQVKLADGREKLGAVLGWAAENHTDEDEPISGNYYLCVGDDVGAIDGISYAGIAEPMELQSFLKLEDLPDVFQNVKIRFCFADGSMEEVTVRAGGELPQNKIPQVPVKAGYSGSWDGLEQAGLTDILFDMTFEAVYKAYSTTIESDEKREDGRPLVLLEGSFTQDAVVTVTKSDAEPLLEKREVLLESWSIATNEPGKTARLLLPGAADTEKLQLQICDADGNWQAAEYSLDGSYIVFSMESESAQIALVQEMRNNAPWLLAGAGILVAFVLAAVLIARKKRSSKEKQPDNELVS